MLTGRIGQVSGKFEAGVDLLSAEGAIGKQTPETTRPIIYKLGIQAPAGTKVKVNSIELKIGKTGIYELDKIVDVKYLSFPDGVEDAIIDYVY